MMSTAHTASVQKQSEQLDLLKSCTDIERRLSRFSWKRIILCALAAHQADAFPHRYTGRNVGLQQHSRRRCCRPTLSLSVASVDQLEKLTVKELKELVKESINQRGLLSKLKRKQDLIGYLESTSASSRNGAVMSEHETESAESPISADAKVTLDPMTISVASLQRKRKSVPIKMPKSDKTAPMGLKGAIFDQVHQRYPRLRSFLASAAASRSGPVVPDEVASTDHGHAAPYTDNDDPRTDHPMLRAARASTPSSDLDVVFVGTASCTPGTTRGVSCTALRLNWKARTSSTILNRTGPFVGGTWLFDVGECTQLQVQRTSAIRPSKITKIFLTHAHGDHTFGLPGLLCLMGQHATNGGDTTSMTNESSSPPERPIEIYGPEGVRMWLRVAIRYSSSRIVPKYIVHEIMDVPMAPEWQRNPRSGKYFHPGHEAAVNGDYQWRQQGLAGEDAISWISQANLMPLEANEAYGEVEGGRNIYPNYHHTLSHGGAPVWDILHEGDVTVHAAPMSHGIPCVGYVVHEQPRPGRLRNEYVEPIVRRNAAALKSAGFAAPLKALAVIKNLPAGQAFTFPDGTVVTQEDAVEPPRLGRKIVICGDTSDSRALTKLAHQADLVIHEATNAYLPGVDHKDTNLGVVTRDALVHGHSTPQIAAHFAKSVQAQRLVLNHFSARYKGDVSTESLSIMLRIEQHALHAAAATAGYDESHVAAAWDLMLLPIPPK